MLPYNYRGSIAIIKLNRIHVFLCFSFTLLFIRLVRENRLLFFILSQFSIWYCKPRTNGLLVFINMIMFYFCWTFVGTVCFILHHFFDTSVYCHGFSYFLPVDEYCWVEISINSWEFSFYVLYDSSIITGSNVYSKVVFHSCNVIFLFSSVLLQLTGILFTLY